MRDLLFCILCITFCVRCVDKTLSIQDWRSYITNVNNGLRKSSEWGGLDIIMDYRPADALIWQELGFPDQINNRLTWDSLESKYSSHLYFNLAISHNNTDLLTALGPQDDRYYDALQALSFQMTECTGMISECQDTIKAAQANFFRNFDGASSDILLTFEKNKIQGCSNFYIYVKNIGLNMPIQKFEFNVRDLLNTPRLSIKITE